MLLPASLTFRDIASEEDDDRMKVMIRQTAHPVVRVIGTRNTEDFCPGGHALTELFREAGERIFVDAERAQTIPGETYGHPSCAGILRFDGFCGSYFLQKSLEPPGS
jgi:hypothetical protein